MRLTPLPLALLALAGLSGADASKPDDSTLGAKPPEGAVVLFDGKSLDGWLANDGKSPAAWPLADGVFTVGKGKGSIRTAKTFGDVKIHLEFNVPLMPDAKGQARGNSGVYLGGAYELQILDSYGLTPKNNDCGAIYQQVVPAVNACKPPLQWQTYDIVFHKAHLNGDKVAHKARVSVLQNGVKIIDEAQIEPTPGGVGTKAGEDGPIMLQDHNNDVQFRNIWVKPI